MHSSNGCRYMWPTSWTPQGFIGTPTINISRQRSHLQTKGKLRISGFFFPFQQNIFLFFLSNSSKQKGEKRVLTALSQLSCHLSPWHKSERKDFYNGWHRCCKLVSPCCLSSHWAYKHPLPTETLTGALRRVCTLLTTAPDPDVGRPVIFHSATEKVDQTWQIKNLHIYCIVAAACLITNAASPSERGGATVGGIPQRKGAFNTPMWWDREEWRRLSLPGGAG